LQSYDLVEAIGLQVEVKSYQFIKIHGKNTSSKLIGSIGSRSKIKIQL